jgi:hypothetical protein
MIWDHPLFKTPAFCLLLCAFKIVAGWWGYQPGRSAVGGKDTAYMKQSDAAILNAPLLFIKQNLIFINL